jgi:glycosyltransferase involved in cell wall biosynthesis
MDQTPDRLHIAWLGPMPGTAGVSGVATLLLVGLASLGHRVDCFIAGAQEDIPPDLRDSAGLEFICSVPRWDWNRWYSRNDVSAFLTGLRARRASFRRLRAAMATRHYSSDPYDCVYQFSNIEIVGVPGRLTSIPLILHPETHAAGELRWLWTERRIARRCQSWHAWLSVFLMLTARSAIQRRSIQRAALVICISRVFRDHLIKDYGVALAATTVIPNPIDLGRFAHEPKRDVNDPAALLVLGRLAVRKGVDQVVELSRALAARGTRAHITVSGGGGLWSDYTALLDDMDPSVSSYNGAVAESAVPEVLRETDVLVQPSKYEPFALTVAEALAAGVPVVGTSEVGAMEGTSVGIATEIVPVADAGALANAVETLLARLRDDPDAVRLAARRDAERLFAADIVCRRISGALCELVAQSRDRR